jgi:hypothetical protein
MLGYNGTVERREGSHLSVCATAKETRERERASERERANEEERKSDVVDRSFHAHFSHFTNTYKLKKSI